MIKFAGVTKAYPFGGQKVTVLDKLDLEIAAGDCVALLGRSGCGKTTTMNLIGLLDQPDSGRYHLAGKKPQHILRMLTPGLTNVTVDGVLCQDATFNRERPALNPVFLRPHPLFALPPLRLSVSQRPAPCAQSLALGM